MQSFQIVDPGQTKTRIQRRPNFALRGVIQPMGLYPYFFTPVLPGETLDKHTLKATIVSAPLADPLGGAWLETWLYYVRITDIDPALADMFIGQLTSTSGYTAGGDQPRYFTKTGQIEWCKRATEAIHNTQFINEGETPVAHPDAVRMIKRINSDVFESTIQIPAGDTDSSFAGDSQGEPMTPQQEAYLRMKNMGMGIASYDEYLRMYGLKAEEVPRAAGVPELLAYRRYWSQPSNVIDPSTGAPTGAWYWKVDEENTKAKRFVEPGFVIGLWAVRPKLLDSKHVWPVASSLWGFEDWMPVYTLDDPAAGIKTIDANSQPFVTEVISSTVNLMFDMRDLFALGEQFVNGTGRFPPAKTSYRAWNGTATNPELRGEYVASADLDALWADDEAAEGLDYDGIASLVIKGHVKDRT